MSFSISALNRFLIKVSLGGCLLIVACGTTTLNGPVLAQPTCISPTLDANPYLSHKLSPGVAAIYSKSLTNLVAARQDALSQLGMNTEHWSDQVNIASDDAHMVRITITYLDPVLVQYIVLNYVLNDTGHIPNGINTPVSVDSFDNELTETMNKLGGRNEMLFVVTVTSPFYREQAYNSNILTMKMPIKQMALISAADMRVTPAHEDHILDENMEITHGTISGIVGFPIAVSNQTQCVLIVDQYTNSLTLDIPSVTLGNNAPFNTQFWHIPYQPLVMESDNLPVPTYDPYYNSNPVSTLTAPPTPNWQPNAQFDDTNWTIYWNDMGRYIWNLVITESHH